MWSFIPIIGPFIQGIVNALNHFEDTAVQRAQIQATKDTATGAQEVDIIKVRAELAKAFRDDVGVCFARDVILNWYAVWVSLIFYYCCFHELMPSYTWKILALPPSVEILTSSIVAFLFVTAWRGK